ncbi:MAG: hypothetical protein AB7S48_02265 [Bacteroidales bacterium]
MLYILQIKKHNYICIEEKGINDCKKLYRTPSSSPFTSSRNGRFSFGIV